MATVRSFAKFVKNKCYNGLYRAAENYVDSYWQSLNLYTRHVHRIGEVELVDVNIQRVYVHDLPGMRVGFDVGLELEIEVKEGDYHYDESDTCFPWIRISCEGDLSCGLDDWEITSIAPYNQKNPPLNSLSDALVPYIPFDRLEDEAAAFLKEFYPEALKVTLYGQKPVSVEPDILVKRLGLQTMTRRVREDGSVYGQLYFVDTDAEMFDAKTGTVVKQHIPGRTIVLTPAAELAFSGGGEYRCGEWCQFCKAKADCRKRAEANMELAAFEFRQPPLLTDDEVEEILGKIDELTSWANDIKDYALRAAVSGKKWTGYKLVEGRSNRKYTDENAVIAAVKKAGFNPYEHKLMGVTAMTSLLGRKQFNEILGSYVTKPQGKPTLAPESDKRPEMTTITDDFKEDN